MKKIFVFGLILLMGAPLFAQVAGNVIFTEIGNGGNKKALYHGGDYVELTVLKDNVTLGGWYLTDFNSPTSAAGERQGRVQFLNGESSIFSKPLAKGTIILICLDSKDNTYGGKKVVETLSVDKDKKTLIVFPYEDSKNFLADSGKIGLTGKDNVVLTSSWEKNSAVDVVSWGRKIKWTGAPLVDLPLEVLDNGNIVYLKNETPLEKRILPENWISITDEKDATPGEVNK